MKRKRGGTNLLLPEIMFILLNLIFFSIIIAFVYISSTGALLYNQAHAKQIALVLDNANPNTMVVIDFENALKIAKKNKVDFSSVVEVNTIGNYVVVRLGGKGGYKQVYFSDFSVVSRIEGNNLILEIGEKEVHGNEDSF